MASELGAKIGQGAFADVHVWAPGQVVKLFRPGFPNLSIRHEARVTRALHAAGAPCAEVFEELTLDDRCGFVMSHLEGPTLLQLSRSGEVPHHETGAILADLATAVHQVPPPSEVPTLQVYLRAALTRLTTRRWRAAVWTPWSMSVCGSGPWGPSCATIPT